ncbi:MAG: ATP-binding protein [Desulfococcaceae bacterium]
MNFDRRAHDLFLLMLNLTQLKHRQRMVDFFVEAINALLEEVRVRVVVAEEGEASAIPIATARHRFGAVVVESVDEAEDPAPEILALIRNGVRMLALILENRLRGRMLADRNFNLESAVRERTAELEDANRRLKREVLERKRSEAALRASEERYRLLLENADEAVLVVQADLIRFHNPRARGLFGRDDRTLWSQPFSTFLHPDDAPPLQERMLGILGGETLEEPITVRIPRSGGKVAFAQGNGVVIAWDGAEAVLLFLRDITEERRLEERLRLAMKMEAVGTLAGGLAHDFNNQLSPILGYAELALETVAPGSEAEGYLRRVVEGAERARTLVHRILTFSRQRLGRFRPVNLEALASEILSEFQPRLPAGCRMVWKSAPLDAGAVEGDPELLKQVIRHICRNALQAIEASGGTVTFSLDRVDDAPVAERESNVLGDGAYLRLRVRDTGPGMKPAVPEKCFEPYFTTRPVGEGLGLAVAHGIVRHHGGQIQVQSEPGAGTVVSIHFPMSGVAAWVPEPAGRVLLADHDPASRRETRDRLTDLGFSVTAAGDGLSALSAFQAAPQTVDLLIADLNLKGLGGERLARAARQFRPGLPVILCASYLENANIGSDGDAVLTKPLSKDRLARTVRELLGRPEPTPEAREETITASADP